MSGNLDLKLTADTRDLIQEQAKLRKDVDAVEKKYEQLMKKTRRETKRAANELERFAKKTTQINQTPAERYRATVMKLRQALDRGLISQETFNRAVRKAKGETGQFVGVMDQAKQQGAGFLGGATARAAAFGLALGAVVKITQELVSAWQDVRQQMDQFASNQRLQSVGLGELGQVADRKTPLPRLISLAKKTFLEGGFTGETAQGLDEAARLVFTLKSANALDQRKLFSQLAQARLSRDPSQFITAAAALNKSLGQQETGGIRALISKAFGASLFATAKAEDLLIAGAKGGVSARSLGISDEEVLGATAVFAEATGTAGEGGTLLSALFKVFEKKQIQGKGILGKVQAVTDTGLEGAELLEFFGGRKEAINALRILQDPANAARLREATAGIRKAEETDEVGRRINLFKQSDVLTADLQRRRGEAAREISAQRNAVITNTLEGTLAAEEAEARRQGQSETRIALRRRYRGIQRFLFGDRRVLQSFGGGDQEQERARRSALRPGVDLVEDRMSRTADAMNRAADNLDRAADNLNQRQQFAKGQRAERNMQGGAVEQ